MKLTGSEAIARRSVKKITEVEQQKSSEGTEKGVEAAQKGGLERVLSVTHLS